LPVYTVALQLQRNDLCDVSINFIRNRAKENFATNAFLEISEELVCSILSDDELAMEELDIFESAIRWGKHRADANNEALESVMSSVVQVIRFPLIGASKLINRVKPTGVVPIELYVEALEFSASPRTVPMEGARFRKRKTPKILATITSSTTTINSTGTISTPNRNEEEPSPARGRPTSANSISTTPTQLNNNNSNNNNNDNELDINVSSSSESKKTTTRKSKPISSSTTTTITTTPTTIRVEELEEDSKIEKNGTATQQQQQQQLNTSMSAPTQDPLLSSKNSDTTPQKDLTKTIELSSSTSTTPTTNSQPTTTSKKSKKQFANNTNNNANPAPIVVPNGSHELKFERDFDENGLFYYIATNGKNADWENPATSGKVLVTSSASFDWGSASNLLAKKLYNTWTASQPGVWVSFSLRGVTILPNHYSLRHGYVSDGANLRNWVLEGSSDGSTWTVLSTHSNDRSLGGNYGTASWKIDGARDFFQHFRIRSTGRDGGNSDRIQLSGIELYGFLQEKS